MKTTGHTQRPWWQEATIYELYVDKWAGDFRTLASRLDYFTELGINTLHILPHYPSPMIDQGYDVSDYRGVRSELGTLADFKMFVDACHGRGIRIITDFVLNHVSEEHPWFVEARASKNNPKRDFFLWSDTDEKFPLGINAFPDIKSSNWISNPATGDFYYATFYPQQPDLNWDNLEVENEMLANMDFWVEMGVDGFRIDAAAHLIKREGSNCKGLPETHAILKRVRKHLDEKCPRGIVLLAEAAQDIESTKEYFGNGDECQMIYNFSLMAQLWKNLATGESEDLQNILGHSHDIPKNCAWAVFLSNHDQINIDTLDLAERIKLIDFLDHNHMYPFNDGDAVSVRIATIFNGDEEKIKHAFDLLYRMPGAPIMYYGDEIGVKNEPVREGTMDSRVYVRGTFDWQESQRHMADPNSLFRHVAQLTRRVSADL